MNIFDRLFILLKRKTNTTIFIPQIDGLRFLAIFMVVLYHINIFVTAKVPFIFNRPPQEYWAIFYLLESDRKSVFLFFVISGFILALPFAKAARGEGKPVELKKYYLRRLTRLEPPYFLVMIACFLGIWLVPGHGFANMFPHTFFGLLPRLGASLIYLHNIIFPQYLSLNPVAWSLEIEIQFYLLVPLLVLVFKLPSATRKSILIFIMAIITALQHYYKPGFYSLYNYLQYFLIGFLLVDLYLSNFKANLAYWLSVPLGLLSLIYIWYADVNLSLLSEYFFIAAVFILYILVLTNGLWQKIFSFKFFTAVGGMCYTIYLLHYNIIPVIGNYTIKFNFFHSYPLAYLWHTLIFLPVILIPSTVFYLLIEQPCMDKDWPVKLYQNLKNIFKRSPQLKEGSR